MPKTSGRRPAAKSPHSKKQQEILKLLESSARRLGLKVSVGRLMVAGLKLRGGSCFLRGRRWLILDRAQPFDELLDIYRQAVSLADLSALGLAEESLEILSPYLEPVLPSAPAAA